jgi:imidazolonepropionase-like amidohydrolase
MNAANAIAVALVLCASAYAQAPGVYAIRDARLVRVSRAPIEHGTVLIRNGLIEAAGENVAVPADAWIIEAKGLTVYPGLIDALSSWGIPGATPPVPARGIATAAITPVAAAPVIAGPEDRPSNTSYLRAADQVVATEKSIETARDGGFTTAVVFPTSNIFSGQGAMIDLAGTRTGQMVVAPNAGQYVSLKTSAFNSYPASLMGVIAYIRQTYLDAGHYKLAKAIYDKHPQGLVRPAYDRTLEAVIESPRVLIPARRAYEIDRMLNLAEELKVKLVLYGGDEAWRAADHLKKSDVPILISLKWPAQDKDIDPTKDEPVRVLTLRDKAPSTPGVLARTGVRFAFYSDGIGNPKELFKAVKKAIDAGLSSDDAIRAMTLSPAEIYGMADRIGSIDKGKIANLVITDGDLFNEKSKVKYVFVDGNKFEPLPDTVEPVKEGEKVQ